MFHDRTKYFEIDLHFTRQKIEDNSMKLEFLQNSKQLADILTKPLGRQKLERYRDKFFARTVEELQ